MAQLVTSNTVEEGFYRIQSNRSKRYLALLDSKGWTTKTGDVYDLYAIRTLTDNSTNNVYSNPSTVIYIQPVSGTGEYTEYKCSAQGVNLKDLTRYNFKIQKRGNSYALRAEALGGAGSATLLETNSQDSYTEEDLPDSGWVSIQPSNSFEAKMFNFYCITGNTDSYFGLMPSLKLGDKYYDTFYASFPFRVVSNGVTVYSINQIKNGAAVSSSFTNGAIIPGGTPVLVECSSEDPRDNQIQPIVDSSLPSSNNLLRGVYFNYVYYPSFLDDSEPKGQGTNTAGANRNHKNRTAYDANTMRVLRISNGRLVFQKVTDLDYLPANKAYLQVSTSAPDELPVMDYSTGIDKVTTDSPQNDDAIYNLNGVRMNPTQSLPHGVYIIGGKKVVK